MHIHKHGGTILGTSRGPVDMAAAVDNLIRRDVNILFTIGGDGTQRGGDQPRDLRESVPRRSTTQKCSAFYALHLRQVFGETALWALRRTKTNAKGGVQVVDSVDFASQEDFGRFAR
jgi:hypothetical protein